MEKSIWQIIELHTDLRRNTESDGRSIVAIMTDGNIVGLCHHLEDDIQGKEILAFAVKIGGKKLDAFSKLWRFYSRNSFEPVSWTPFDENEAPKDWKKGRDEAEPIIFWKYTGKHIKYKSSDDFLNRVAPSKIYDEAQQKRNEEIEK